MMPVQPMSKPTNLVLLIDDEPKIRRFIRAGFELHGGFTVQEAVDAAEGLHAATFNTPTSSFWIWHCPTAAATKCSI